MTADLAAVAARLSALARESGLAVGPDRTARFAAAVTLTRPETIRQLRDLALATLIADPADIARLDRILALVFGGMADPAAFRGDQANAPLDLASGPPRTSGQGVGVTPPSAGVMAGGSWSTRPRTADSDEPDQQRPVAALAADVERLAGRDFGALDAADLARLSVLMRQLAVATPLRRGRRLRAGAGGTHVDLRATLRAALRGGGYPVRLVTRRRRDRPRRLVVLCDISGSMEPYARALLQLVYCAAGAKGAEVFTFATRLTRLTRALARVRPEVALERAGRAAPDWSGGTRLGSALARFNRDFAARGVARGAVVLIVSDGWDTGDPALVEAQMARLSRLAYRIVWANPRTRSPRYEPKVRGMAAAWPYCDEVVSAHSLDAVAGLLAALAGTRVTRRRDLRGLGRVQSG
ncbi:vWA domain-containing protein [Luedemannella helvata]|uniref:VWA domain-containing protein n=1 Tax=Luedemannella helvata TaxID=349315 RepID=A0ABP4WD96_9ACTN